MDIQVRQYTTAEFWEIANLPENQDRRLELIDGEIIELSPSFLPSMIAMKIGRLIGNYLATNPIGYITGADGGYVLSPQNTLIPDVGYISKVRLPSIPAREVQGHPDLAIEVVSPTDEKINVHRKAMKYIRYGTPMVWVVYPGDQTVEVYTPGATINTVNLLTIEGEGVLDGGAILPGFTLSLKDIFAS